MKTQERMIKISVPAPEKSSRWLAAATLLFFIPKLILLIPHIIVMYGLGIVAFFLTVFAQVAVLISGTYPRNIHTIVVGILRWQTRVNAYALGLRDEYPPFTFED